MIRAADLRRRVDRLEGRAQAIDDMPFYEKTAAVRVIFTDAIALFEEAAKTIEEHERAES